MPLGLRSSAWRDFDDVHVIDAASSFEVHDRSAPALAFPWPQLERIQILDVEAADGGYALRLLPLLVRVNARQRLERCGHVGYGAEIGGHEPAV